MRRTLFALLLLALVVVPSGQSAAPTVTITEPKADAVYQASDAITVRGSYRDDDGVRSVTVAYFNRHSQTYRQRDGSFAPKHYAFPTQLSGTARSGKFSADPVSLPPGSYAARVRATDKEGLVGAATVLFRREGSAAEFAADPGYLTVTFSRSGWVPALHCRPYPGSVTLEEVVQWLASNGIPSTGGVVTGWTHETAQTCRGPQLYPSWADLIRLHTLYGFEAVSHSATYEWPATMTAEDYDRETCQTLPVLEQHGFLRAWGLFMYPGSDQTDLARQVAMACFAFGRVWGDRPSYRDEVLQFPHEVRALSVLGGKCNNPALSCYTMTVRNDRRYMLPAKIAERMRPFPGQWSAVQFYRFVSGARLTGRGTWWDCRSSAPADHWVTEPEVYCFEDLQAAVLEARASSHALAVDAAAVADAWGRRPAPGGTGSTPE